MKNQLLSLILCLFVSTSFSQNVDFDWAAQMGGLLGDQGYAVESDVYGNVYTAGLFRGTVDFDPGTGVSNLTSSGSIDMFIQKLDSNGSFLWAKKIGATNFDAIRDLNIDIDGNLLFTGFFQGTVDFNPGIGIYNLASAGFIDVFILKLDSDGDFIWAKSIGGTARDISNSITSDNQGNVLVTGEFSGTADFQPDSAFTYNISEAGGGDIFIEKLDSNGNFLWVRSFGDIYTDIGNSISTDSKGNVYTAGSFKNSDVDFDPSPRIFRLINKGEEDVFIQKLNPSGSLIWVKGMGGNLVDWAYSITIDQNDNVITTGLFSDTVDFDPRINSSYNLISLGQRDIFIQKLDTNGNLIWAKSMGGLSDDEGYSVTTDQDNNIYTTGFFADTVNFNTDSIGINNLVSSGNEDIFIQKLDFNGNFLWSESFGGSNFDRARSISVDEEGSIYTTGNFESAVDFNPDTLSTNILSSNGDLDVFVLKLNQCGYVVDSIVAIACQSYTSPSGKTWTQSGTYSDTIANSTGCDSLLSINLTITRIDTSLTIVNHVKISSNDSLASYQWIDCNNGNSPIVGDTNRSFIATSNGNYAVVLDNNGCVDTSACVSILSVGVNESNSEQVFINFYPNPNNGIFTMELGDEFISNQFQVYDAKGTLLIESQIKSKRSTINLSAYGKGVYFLKINNQGINRKIVVVD